MEIILVICVLICLALGLVIFHTRFKQKKDTDIEEKEIRNLYYSSVQLRNQTLETIQKISIPLIDVHNDILHQRDLTMKEYEQTKNEKNMSDYKYFNDFLNRYREYMNLFNNIYFKMTGNNIVNYIDDPEKLKMLPKELNLN